MILNKDSHDIRNRKVSGAENNIFSVLRGDPLELIV